jgi:hypothetical protein
MADETGGAAPSERAPEVKSGICPYCGIEKGGLVWNFFQNVMQIMGRVVLVDYATCSCAGENCGRILNAMILNMRDHEVQSVGPSLIHGPRRH